MLANYGERVAVDLGTGDGRYPYDFARKHPDWFAIGIDANAGAMARSSGRALRKPAKGGLPNVLYAVASVETLPVELHGVAARVTVLLPWSSLLRALALPEHEVLAGIRRLCRPGATLEATVSLDVGRERAEIERLGLRPLPLDRRAAELAARYRASGFRLDAIEPVAQESLRRLPSTWAKRLAYGRPRPVWSIRARAAEAALY